MMKREIITNILQQALKPTAIIVIDESHLHAGHNDDAKKGGTHFKVTIVSDAFKGKGLVDRHRMVYEALKEAKVDYHALAIKAKSHEEYSA